MTPEQTIKDRVKARSTAQVLEGFVAAEISDYTLDQRQTFWDEFDRLSRPKPESEQKGFSNLLLQTTLTPMTDVEAKRFGAEVLEWGKHKGTRIDEVPLEYLQWYADQPFQKQLRRYLASPRIRAEDTDNT